MSFRGRLDFLVRRLRRAVARPADAASDASLLERFVAGRDEAAFELLLWRHGPMVLGVCRRMLRCDQDAEDAFQAAFLLLARKAGSIRRREALPGWLYQTARRVAMRARQAARKRLVAVPLGADPTAPDAEPDILWRDLRPVLDEEVQRLPMKYRLPIVLCYFQGRTHAEAARELGCPRGTVAVRLQRGRELLRGRLTRRGLALSATALAVLVAERTASAAAPAILVHATLKAALLYAAGKAAAGAVSAQAVAWTQGVLRSMFLSKLKMLAAAALLLGAVGTGAGLLMSRTAAASPAAPRTDAPAAADRAGESKATAEVPSEREGRIALIGTEIKPDETVPARDLVKMEVSFLAVEVGARDDPKGKDLAPEPWWADLDAGGTKAYVRWKDGDALPGSKLFIAREVRRYRKLQVGDSVEEGQLIARLEQGPALDALEAKMEDLEVAEQDCVVAKTAREEAERRAASAVYLWQKGKGFIAEDDYRGALLNRDRYVEEEAAKKIARRRAEREVLPAVHALGACEVRSADRGIVKAILKRRGEAIHNYEAIVRLEVQDSAPAEKPGAKPADAPAVPVLNVPAQRDGVLLVVGREVKEGEKVLADRLVTIKTGEGEKTYLRLKEGDVVEEGQLLARIDDRLARLDLEVAKSKVEAAEADLVAAGKTKAEADRRYQRLGTLRAKGVVTEEEVDAAKLTLDQAAGEERVKTAAVRQVQAGLKAAEAILEMYEVRSPVRGVVKAVCKSRGEAVKSLETVVQIQEKAKD